MAAQRLMGTEWWTVRGRSLRSKTLGGLLGGGSGRRAMSGKVEAGGRNAITLFAETLGEKGTTMLNLRDKTRLLSKK